MNKYDTAHKNNAHIYSRNIKKSFQNVMDQFAKIGSNPKAKFNKSFVFDSDKIVRKQADLLTLNFAKELSGIIEGGIKTEWSLSNNKNDNLVNQYLKSERLLKLAKVTDHNKSALSSFINRQVGGLGLSDRVWDQATRLRDEMEAHIGIGLMNGDSADVISRRARQYLNEPDKLFRRVRDKNGKLILSKNARVFHPGPGKYRSSFKNARRLAVTEANMAYRKNDHLRWQKMDFVVGFEIKKSASHPAYDICDPAAGKYPKNFVFTGWHPQCFCYAVPIMLNDEEFDGYIDSLLGGKKFDPTKSKNFIGNVPDSFQVYLMKNASKFNALKNGPYWIRDNFKNGLLSDGLNFQVYDLIKSSTNLSGGYVKGEINDIYDIEALMSSYATQFPEDFQRGFKSLKYNASNDAFMSTNSHGRITVYDYQFPNGFNPYKELKQALHRIKMGKGLSFNNEYALEALYHEVLHNKAKLYKSLPSINVGYRRQSMEVLNQFIARHDYPEFISRIGGRARWTSEVMSSGLGYSDWVTNFRYLIKKTGIKEVDALDNLRRILIDLPYDKIDENLIKFFYSKTDLTKKNATMLMHSIRVEPMAFRSIANSLVWFKNRHP